MAKTDLHKISTLPPKGAEKEAYKTKTKEILCQLDDYQNLLYAEGRHSVLIVLQGMDASGKDGLIRDVFTYMNPQGISVQSFKVPTEEELGHDFLWRIHKHAPAKGMIQVFNRSHYEDVLVVRVHGQVSDELAQGRMKAINNFERMLTEHNNTHILKFYLHVSAEEQEGRLKERMVNEQKMWKYNANDFNEAKLRNEYIKYYNEVFNTCNEVPWNIVPADKNWYKEYVVAETLLNLFKSLNMKYPVLKDHK
ncbi:PPK2 family polyphosphate kinase [Haoranjiania flava]|uniref:Polyphosphate kinase n=1 Tax=Haoranjiania flava TaxID=1856322 RepID=A0AAE3LJB8_9BACT|nr:PPK2 family polyphosphate kinase [Haoranjiania flava]MCU7693567.1 polyphosphate kinase [Haoranjiania flava]